MTVTCRPGEDARKLNGAIVPPERFVVVTLPKALSQLSVMQVNDIVSHLTTHQKGHGTMHTRAPLKAGGKPGGKVIGTRHLQAIVARPGGFEACLSGPGIFLHYDVTVVSNGVVIGVRADRVLDPAEEAALEQSLAAEILAKVAEERARTGAGHRPNRSSGSYYLMRNKRVLPASHHAACQRAVTAGVLDLAFVQKLQSWGFELIYQP
jgi:hypothetical protein